MPDGGLKGRPSSSRSFRRPGAVIRPPDTAHPAPRATAAYRQRVSSSPAWETFVKNTSFSTTGRPGTRGHARAKRPGREIRTSAGILRPWTGSRCVVGSSSLVVDLSAGSWASKITLARTGRENPNDLRQRRLLTLAQATSSSAFRTAASWAWPASPWRLAPAWWPGTPGPRPAVPRGGHR